MREEDRYSSIKAASAGSFRDRGSRFLAFAFPVESEADVKEHVDALKKEYHDARHCCYAYRLGLDGERWRANDDGEPSGSAARQILSRIDSASLSDVLVVVVRYFGGIKLGIPGLINAYRCASEAAISSAEKIEKTAGSWFSLDFGYSEMPAVMKAVKEFELPSRNQDFGENCRMEVRVRLSQMKDFFARIEKICNFNEIN